jgi:hypothetical protein
MRIIFLLNILFTTIILNAQIREAQVRFPLPGEVHRQMKLNIDENIPFIHKSDYLPTVKSNNGYLDTTYKIRYSDGFFDVNDWDSAYFVSGYVRDSTHYYYDPDHPTLLALAKIDYLGNLLWKRTDSVFRGDHFVPTYNTNMIRLVDGDFLQIGFIPNDYNNWKNYDWKVAIYTKFDTDGSTIWQKVYKDTAYLKSGDWPMSVIPEKDGGFTIAALIASDSKHLNPYDTSDVFLYVDTSYIGLIRYDSLGNEVMRKRHFIGGHPVTPSIGLLMEQKDGGYIVGGVNYFSGDLKNYYLLKTDSLFNWEWKKTFGQTAASEPMIQIIPKNKSLYNFAVFRSDTPIVYDAYNNKYYNGYYQIGIMDSAFNIINDTVFMMYLTDPSYTYYYYDAGHIIGAANNSQNGLTVCSDIGGYGANIVNLDSNLSFQWNSWVAQYPYFREEPYKIRRAHDGGYLIVGRSYRSGVGGWFVKTDTLGFALPNGADTLYHIGFEEKGVLKTTGIIAYPNPTSDFVSLQFDKLVDGDIEVSVFDFSGRLLLNKKYANRKIIKLDLTSLAKGIYLLNISINNHSKLAVKIIKN